jgi:hypothetical protein
MHEQATIESPAAAKAPVPEPKPVPEKEASTAAAPVRPALVVAPPDDPAEKEAEQNADRLNTSGGLTRQAMAKNGATAGAGVIGVDTGIAGAIEVQIGKGKPMEAPDRSFMESRFGVSFQRVQIHAGNNATHLSSALQADAFTLGSDIFFNEGKYQPGSAEGQQLLAHELTHVVQQQQGRVQRQRIHRVPRPASPANLADYTTATRQQLVLDTANYPFDPTHYMQKGIVETPRQGYDIDYIMSGSLSSITWLHAPLRSMARSIFNLMEGETDTVPANSVYIIPIDLSNFHEDGDSNKPAGPDTRFRFACAQFDSTGKGAKAVLHVQIIVEDIGKAPALTNASETAAQRIARFQADYGFTRAKPSDFSDEEFNKVLLAISMVPTPILTQISDIPFRRAKGKQTGPGGVAAEYHFAIKDSVVTRSITVYEKALDATTTTQSLAFLMVHELGHALASRQSETATSPGKDLSNETGKGSFREAANADGGLSKAPTEYGRTGWGEYFAEAFSMYINFEQTLEVLRPTMYAWFNGRFGQAPTAAAATPAPTGAATGTSESVPAGDAATIQRSPTPTLARYKSFTQILDLSLSAFIEYTHSQADWFTAPGLTQQQRSDINYILFFANNDVQSAFPGKTIRQFHTLFNTLGEVADERMNRLQAYAAATSHRKFPFELSNFAGSLTAALSVGADILKLRNAFPEYVLRTAMKEEPFKMLRQHNLVQAVIDYYERATQRPVFQAQNGGDFESFVFFWLTGRSPLHYDSTNLRMRIRNYHRFERVALDRLVRNFSNTTKTKPLTLILHTALDHNAAFHQDPFLTEVITNNSMLTLAVEGFETLGEMQASIAPIATTYGQSDRINQLMFAGHGNARSIELTGTIGERIHPDTRQAIIRENSGGLDLDSNRAESDSLMREVLRFMDNDTTLPADRQRHSRIVFNACLTGSNAVRQALDDGDMPAAQTAISDFIRNNASLATYLGNLATTEGASNITSIGSNASFGQIGLLGSGNALDIISSDDPAITASKMQYVERGTEPEGALRAILECWATDQPGTLATMGRRMARTESNTWDLLLIRAAYRKIIADYATHGDKIRQVGQLTGYLGEMKFESHCRRIDNIRKASATLATRTSTDDFYETLVSSLAGASEFTGNDRIKSTMLQLWAMKDAGKDSDLLDSIAAPTVNRLLEYVDVGWLGANRGVVARLFGIANANGTKKLALHGVLAEPLSEPCKAHLVGLLAGSVTFPPALGITSALGGATTENSILELMGISAAAAPAGTPVTANLRLRGEAQNTVHVTPIQQYCRFEGYLTIFPHERPESGGRVLGDYSHQTDWYVLGDTGEWYAVEFTYTGETAPSVAFIRKRTSSHASIRNLNP